MLIFWLACSSSSSIPQNLFCLFTGLLRCMHLIAFAQTLGKPFLKFPKLHEKENGISNTKVGTEMVCPVCPGRLPRVTFVRFCKFLFFILLSFLFSNSLLVEREWYHISLSSPMCNISLYTLVVAMQQGVAMQHSNKRVASDYGQLFPT